jgi:alkylation response protein AidB-like acyl-CoA dehydrogenase
VDEAEIERHPLVTAAARLAADLLFPGAADVDAGQVPRSHLEALAAAGLFGITAPLTAGGSAAPGPVARRVHEILAGADASTWFVYTQHMTPVRALVEYGGHDGVLAEMAAGRVIGGLAVAHLRRWPQRPVEATRLGGGWRLDGVAPWYTGWGLNDVALLFGASADAEVVCGLVPARPSSHLRASPPMRLAAMGSTLTVRLEVDGLVIPDADVVAVQPFSQWAAADRGPTVNPSPAVFGIARTALRLLDEHGQEASEPAAAQAAARIGEQLARVRADAYRLIDEAGAAEQVERRLELRSCAHQLMVQATTAYVVACAGRAMSASSPAQRLAREAMFMLIQAQTAQARTAALQAWGR